MSRVKAERFVDIDISAPRNSLVGKDLQEFLDLVAPSAQSQKPTYNTDGTIDTITVYRSLTQAVANRICLVAFVYDSNLYPLTETINLYSPSNGNNLLKTVTHTYTWDSEGTLTNVERTTV